MYGLFGGGAAVTLLAGAGLATEMFGTKDGQSPGEAKPVTPNSAPASPSAAAVAAGKLLCTGVTGKMQPNAQDQSDVALVRLSPVLSSGQTATEVVSVFTNTDQGGAPYGDSVTTRAGGNSVASPMMTLWGRAAVTGQVATGELFACPTVAVEVDTANVVTTRALEPVPTDPPTALPSAPTTSPS